MDELLMLFRGQRVSGIVIHVDPPYMIKDRKGFLRILLSLMVALALLPVAIGVAIGLWVMAASLSIVGFGLGGPGIFSRLASQLLGFYLTGKLFGPRNEVPVRDFRLRESSGNERLVRIVGELTSGTVNVGDSVEIDGYDRGGTIVFSRGKNTRIGSEIRVRRP